MIKNNRTDFHFWEDGVDCKFPYFSGISINKSQKILTRSQTGDPWNDLVVCSLVFLMFTNLRLGAEEAKHLGIAGVQTKTKNKQTYKKQNKTNQKIQQKPALSKNQER